MAALALSAAFRKELSRDPVSKQPLSQPSLFLATGHGWDSWVWNLFQLSFFSKHLSSCPSSLSLLIFKMLKNSWSPVHTTLGTQLQ